MTFGLRVMVVAFAAFAASGLVGALVAWIWARRTQDALLADTTLFMQRLLPTLCGAVATVLGLLLGFAAVVGDLAESIIKRSTGVKDSGNLLPGIGGALDLLDSLLFTAPLLFFYMRLVIRVP